MAKRTQTSEPDRTKTKIARALERLTRADGVRDAWAGTTAPLPLAGTRIIRHARLLCVIDGKMPVAYAWGGDQVERKLQVGDVLYTAPQGWYRPQESVDRTVLGIIFTPDYLRLLINEHRIGEGRWHSAWHHTAAPFPRPGRHLLAILDDLAKRGDDPVSVEHLIRVLLRFVHVQLCSDRPIATGRGRSTWQAVCEHVRENLGEPIDRNLVARALGLHPGHISRLFKQYGEDTFNRFLRRVRMEQAMLLLGCSDDTIAAIAARCGYASSAYFITEFRRYHGTSPGRYRDGLKA